ncbi:hypothetical protein LTR06_011450 [Exophiala xenobiotica]|nr:hypothetical protein LTR06_011450 [Exophiala xenobiotica]
MPPSGGPPEKPPGDNKRSLPDDAVDLPPLPKRARKRIRQAAEKKKAAEAAHAASIERKSHAPPLRRAATPEPSEADSSEAQEAVSPADPTLPCMRCIRSLCAGNSKYATAAGTRIACHTPPGRTRCGRCAKGGRLLALLPPSPRLRLRLAPPPPWLTRL